MTEIPENAIRSDSETTLTLTVNHLRPHKNKDDKGDRFGHVVLDVVEQFGELNESLSGSRV